MDVWRIRSFLNTDTPSLAKIWAEHHAASGSASRCSVNLWDQCILSKVYFRPENLVLALDANDQAVGVIHFGSGMSDDGGSQAGPTGMIHLLCIAPHADEDSIAAALIEHAVTAIRSTGLNRCLAIGAPDTSLFYLGIADGDNLMGVLASDTRALSWLQAAGFKPSVPTESWELALNTFRPPMDRMQISIRRSCSIGRILEESHPSWWISTVLGHCDQSRFTLITHGLPRVEMEAHFWYPDASMRGIDSGAARLRLSEIPSDDTNRERLLCLIAESARQLQQERKRCVRVVASAQYQPAIQLMQRLGFRATTYGMVMSKELNS